MLQAFVEALDQPAIGFSGAMPANTGRPVYHPPVLLKLYIYGYLNRVQSSRRLEREAGRNVELMWLLGRLVPDHKTIADFRKNYGRALRRVCRSLRCALPPDGPAAGSTVVVDGSMFKAVNNRDRNFTHAKMARRVAQIEESIARYLHQLDSADRQEPSEAIATKVARLHEEDRSSQARDGPARISRPADATDARSADLPDRSRLPLDGDERPRLWRGRISNVQVVVETKHYLIGTHEVTNVGNVRAQLAPMAKAAKQTLDAEQLHVIADRGYFDSDQIKECVGRRSSPSPCASRKPQARRLRAASASRTPPIYPSRTLSLPCRCDPDATIQ